MSFCLGEPIPTTKQEYLDLHIRKSKEGKFPSVEKPPVDPDDESEVVYFCRYRQGDRACPIGLLIPDGRYREGMEGRRINSLVDSYGVELPDWLSLLEAHEIQFAHDSEAEENSWDHEAFVGVLRNIRVFSDCVFPE